MHPQNIFSMTSKTIFSQILNGDIPCDEVYKDTKCLAFRDVQPQAPVHILVIPKKPITSLQDVQIEDEVLLGHLLLISSKSLSKKV